jgi:hypothetical protein
MMAILTYFVGTWGLLWELVKWILVLIPVALTLVPLAFVWDVGRVLK